MESSDFNNTQSLFLQKKTGRSAKCRTWPCRNRISKGMTCFALEGVLSVPYNSEKARTEKFYFCAKQTCIVAPPPPWTNMRIPRRFKCADDVSVEERSSAESFLTLDVQTIFVTLFTFFYDHTFMFKKIESSLLTFYQSLYIQTNS